MNEEQLNEQQNPEIEQVAKEISEEQDSQEDEFEDSSEDQKVCPYCGKAIKKSAKKCKHCGKWVEKQCPECAEWVNAKAKKCRYCGYILDPWQRRLQEKAAQEQASKAEEANSSEEEENEDSNVGFLLYFEAVLIAFILGDAYDLDWWGYIVIAIVLIGLLNIHTLRVGFCIGVSIIWGFIGACLAPFIFGASEGQIAARILTDNFADYWWLGLIATIVSLVLHASEMSKKTSD